MAVADNTRLKVIEAEIKKLYQMFEESTDEHRAERARAAEITDKKIDSIQNTLTQLLDNLDLSAISSTTTWTSCRTPLLARWVNFDIPKFDDTDALGWIFSMDQYFDLCRIPEPKQIGIATFHMQGVAIPWFQMSQRTTPFQYWNHPKQTIEIEFGPSLYESSRELLFKLQQRSSVTDYYTEFIALANRTNIEPPEALRYCFISGLHNDIKREVKAQCPPSLLRAVSLARLYEDKFTPISKTTMGPSPYRPTPLPPKHNSLSRPPLKTSLPPLLPTPTSPALNINNPIKRMSPTEQQRRRE